MTLPAWSSGRVRPLHSKSIDHSKSTATRTIDVVEKMCKTISRACERPPLCRHLRSPIRMAPIPQRRRPCAGMTHLSLHDDTATLWMLGFHCLQLTTSRQQPWRTSGCTQMVLILELRQLGHVGTNMTAGTVCIGGSVADPLSWSRFSTHQLLLINFFVPLCACHDKSASEFNTTRPALAWGQR